MPWSRPFDEPIQPPKGKKLVTLKDAAAYILALPKSKQQSPEWQAAGEAVIMAAEDRGPLMHAHVGMMLAARRKADSGIRFVCIDIDRPPAWENRVADWYEGKIILSALERAAQA